MTYQNVTKHFQKQPKEVYVLLTLINPYKQSFDYVLNLSIVWNIRILNSASNSPTVEVSFIYEKIKKLLNTDPIIGKEYIIKGTEKSIKKIKILDIIEHDLKNGD